MSALTGQASVRDNSGRFVLGFLLDEEVIV
jgi:hypothetical protein